MAVNRIIIRAPNWIGDAVTATPAIRALRRAFPQSRVALMCRPWVAPIYQHSPDVDEVTSINDKGAGIGFLAAIRAIRRGRYDLGVLFPNSFGTALALWAGGVRRRVGYDRDGRRFFLTDPVPATEAVLRAHIVEYYLNLVRGLVDVDKAERKQVLVAGAKEEEEVARILEAAGAGERDRLIGVNPGAAYGTAKRWLPERYAALSGHLTREHGVRIVVTGSASEAELGEQVAAMAREPAPGREPVVNLAGKLTLGQFVALMRRLRLFITNDSGAMHIAAAMDVPIVAIFGSTDWIATAPYSDKAVLVRKEIDCAPCLLRECPHEHECMTKITEVDVLRAVEEQMRRFGI